MGDLSALRSVGSTGAPLPVEGFEWVYEQLPDVWLTSVSGGTDVCTAFVGGSPLMPVVAGEISCRYLGARVEAFDDEGRSLVGEQGELVLTAPLPSMPSGFWGDDDGRRYRDAYFSRFAGVWCHGDWLTITDRGSCTITGRSDATLNRGGVRLGTSEFYAVVESVPGVADSLVVHLEDPEGGPGRLVLFVTLRPPGPPSTTGPAEPDRRPTCGRGCRPATSPTRCTRCRPSRAPTPARSWRCPVKRILLGAPPDQVASRGSLADPEALDAFVGLAADRDPAQPGGGSGSRQA